ncbi:hypothetical protein KQI63_03245 [bacterium]|nr:hypothetical protein [bacterium]
MSYKAMAYILTNIVFSIEGSYLKQDSSFISLLFSSCLLLLSLFVPLLFSYSSHLFSTYGTTYLSRLFFRKIGLWYYLAILLSNIFLGIIVYYNSSVTLYIIFIMLFIVIMVFTLSVIYYLYISNTRGSYILQLIAAKLANKVGQDEESATLEGLLGVVVYKYKNMQDVKDTDRIFNRIMSIYKDNILLNKLSGGNQEFIYVLSNIYRESLASPYDYAARNINYYIANLMLDLSMENDNANILSKLHNILYINYDKASDVGHIARYSPLVHWYSLIYDYGNEITLSYLESFDNMMFDIAKLVIDKERHEDYIEIVQHFLHSNMASWTNGLFDLHGYMLEIIRKNPEQYDKLTSTHNKIDSKIRYINKYADYTIVTGELKEYINILKKHVVVDKEAIDNAYEQVKRSLKTTLVQQLAVMIMSYALYKGKYSYVKDFISFNQPDDAIATYGNGLIIPDKMNDIFRNHQRLEERAGLSIRWDRHHGPLLYFRVLMIVNIGSIANEHLQEIEIGEYNHAKNIERKIGELEAMLAADRVNEMLDNIYGKKVNIMKDKVLNILKNNKLKIRQAVRIMVDNYVVDVEKIKRYGDESVSRELSKLREDGLVYEDGDGEYEEIKIDETIGVKKEDFIGSEMLYEYLAESIGSSVARRMKQSVSEILRNKAVKEQKYSSIEGAKVVIYLSPYLKNLEMIIEGDKWVPKRSKDAKIYDNNFMKREEMYMMMNDNEIKYKIGNDNGNKLDILLHKLDDGNIALQYKSVIKIYCGSVVKIVIEK